MFDYDQKKSQCLTPKNSSQCHCSTKKKSMSLIFFLKHFTIWMSLINFLVLLSNNEWLYYWEEFDV